MNAPSTGKPYAAAVIPSFNEGSRIVPAIKAIIDSPLVREIIVVDDGSDTNETELAVRSFHQVRYLRNEVNRGKGFSMERGVNSTTAPIIFFCDADLEGITPEIVSSIIEPVANETYDMFIGIRNNVAQKSFLPFALNSGERALRREVWEKLPKFYKHRFRIEVGMNYFVRHHGKGYGYKLFPYYQTAKERKYGFWKGTVRRWKMNGDVSLAWARANFIDRFRNFAWRSPKTLEPISKTS
ncbi:MAG: glycosyltransferase family 2 protein [Patescibacteria group bacterium]